MTHRQLLLETWRSDYVEHAHYVRIYMEQLRRKHETGPSPAQPRYLLAGTGVGYRLVSGK